MLEMRERVLLIALALIALLAVSRHVRELDRRVGQLEEWRSR